MSVFAPTNNPNDASDQTVGNLAFYPAIEVATFRSATRTQDTVTDQRVIQAMRTAIRDTNRELAVWRAEQEAAGHATLADVPGDGDYGDGEPGTPTHRYLTAVYSRAKALLVEWYRDENTTDPGDARATGYASTRDVYLREAIEAVRDLLGEPRTTVELI